jgi:hypothetical protein
VTAEGADIRTLAAAAGGGVEAMRARPEAVIPCSRGSAGETKGAVALVRPGRSTRDRPREATRKCWERSTTNGGGAVTRIGGAGKTPRGRGGADAEGDGVVTSSRRMSRERARTTDG